MSAEAPQPSPEEQRQQQIELRQGQEAQLFANYMIKDVVDAIAKEVEPGGEFERMPLVIRKTAETLGAYDVFENLINPYVEATNLAKHWTSVSNEALAIATNPEDNAQRIQKMEEELANLAAQADFAGIKKRVLQHELGDMDSEELEAMTQRDEQFMRLQALTQEEITKKHEKDSMRVRLSNERQRLSLISESAKTLQEPGAQERLKRKAEQAQDNGAAVIGLDEFMRYFVTMEQRNFGIDDLGTAAIDGRVEKLSSRRMEKLLSIPGLKEGVDKAMWIMLNLDVGRDVVEGQEVLPNFKPEGYEHTRNYCAIEHADNQTLEDFKKAMMDEVKREIVEELGEDYVEEADNLARLAVDFAMAYHDSMLLSSFYDTPRDANTLQPMKVGKVVTEDDKEIYKRESEITDSDKERTKEARKKESGEEEELEIEVSNGGGVFLAKLPTDAEKIFGTRGKLQGESESGYKAPLSIVVATMPDFLMTDLLRTYTVEDEEGNKHSAFDLIIEKELELSEMYAESGEAQHVLALLGIFHAVKAYNATGEIPEEIIQLLPSGISLAEKVIEQYATWAKDYFKRLEKSLKKVYTEPYEENGEKYEVWKAEAMRILINTTNGFWCRITRESPKRGGKRSNTEEPGIAALADTYNEAKRVFMQWMGHQTALMTKEQRGILGELIDDKMVRIIAHDQIIEGDLKNPRLTSLGKRLVKRCEDQEPKERDSARANLIDPETYPLYQE